MRAPEWIPALLLLAPASVGCTAPTGPSGPQVDLLEISGAPALSAEVGTTVRLVAHAYDRRCDIEYCWYVSVQVAIRWTTSDPSVVRIETDPSGKRAMLVAPGVARLVASAGGLEDTMTVTVLP